MLVVVCLGTYRLSMTILIPVLAFTNICMCAFDHMRHPSPV